MLQEIMNSVDIIVIGGSAGGVDPLVRLVRLLPSNPPAAIFVTTHRAAPHSLAEVLRLEGTLQIDEAQDGAKIQRGRLYVCPADYNLSLVQGRMRVEHSPREVGFRPSINALFRSAAAVYGRRVAGVLLSGLREDGAAGLWQIKKHSGITIVQDPSEAAFPSMPEAAIAS